VAGAQFLPGKIGKTVGADPTAVASPVFLACGDLLAAQRAAKWIPPWAVMGVAQSVTSLDVYKILNNHEKLC